jgi:hypothetical protein
METTAHKPEADKAAIKPQAEIDQETVDKMSALDKQMIIREAVSWYLRNNYIQGPTAIVCQDFINEADKALRGPQKAAGEPHAGHNPAHAADEPFGGKSKNK